LAVNFDEKSVMLFSVLVGIDNPVAILESQTTLSDDTEVVDSAPKPDYELED